MTIRLEYETYCDWSAKCPKHNVELDSFAMMINYRMYRGYKCGGKVIREPDKTIQYHCNFKLWEDTPPKIIHE